MVLTVHHLQVSQSERIPWLCEELGIDYELKLYKRSPVFAPAEYQALHPQGSAPVIQDDGLMLGESGACIEYIYHKHGAGKQKLFLEPSHPDYANFLFWWHWANGTLQPALLRLTSLKSAGIAADTPTIKMAMERLNKSMAMLNDRLSGNTWLAGDEFTVADIMLVFSLTTMRNFSPYSLEEYGSIVAYLGRIGARGAYQRAMKKSDPDMELLLGPSPPEKTFMQRL